MTSNKIKYNLIWLQQQLLAGEKFNYLYFWGHRKSKTGKISASCFSQWWAEHPFVVDNISYLTAEHWMMSQKALLFEDQQCYQKIIQAESASQVKALGRQIDNFDADIWQKECVAIVIAGNHNKFSQHKELTGFLLSTGNDILVEASPVDPIWGIGLSVDDIASKNPFKWKGSNLLGFALMAVRDMLL